MTTEEGDRKAKEFDALFCEVSAKVGTNVNNLFYSISANLPGNENNVVVQSTGRSNFEKI